MVSPEDFETEAQLQAWIVPHLCVAQAVCSEGCWGWMRGLKGSLCHGPNPRPMDRMISLGFPD